MKRVRFSMLMVVGFPDGKPRGEEKQLRRRFRTAIRENQKILSTGMVVGDMSSLRETVEAIERLVSIARRAKASAFNRQSEE